ncbi:hypothetical protein GCM10023162_06930 [Klenkia terrae]
MHPDAAAAGVTDPATANPPTSANATTAASRRPARWAEAPRVLTPRVVILANRRTCSSITYCPARGVTEGSGRTEQSASLAT